MMIFGLSDGFSCLVRSTATLGGTHKFFTANSNICSSSSSRAMMKRDDDDDDGRRTILPNSLSFWALSSTLSSSY